MSARRGLRARFAAAIFARTGFSALNVLKGHLGTGATIVVQLLELLIGEVLDCSELIFRPLHCQHEFRQFELNRKRVAVLRVLDQEYHQKRHDGRASIYHQLPGVAVAEYRAGRYPDSHDSEGEQECYRVAGPLRYCMCKSRKLMRQR